MRFTFAVQIGIDGLFDHSDEIDFDGRWRGVDEHWRRRKRLGNGRFRWLNCGTNSSDWWCGVIAGCFESLSRWRRWRGFASAIDVCEHGTARCFAIGVRLFRRGLFAIIHIRLRENLKGFIVTSGCIFIRRDFVFDRAEHRALRRLFLTHRRHAKGVTQWILNSDDVLQMNVHVMVSMTSRGEHSHLGRSKDDSIEKKHKRERDLHFSRLTYDQHEYCNCLTIHHHRWRLLEYGLEQVASCRSGILFYPDGPVPDLSMRMVLSWRS